MLQTVLTVIIAGAGILLIVASVINGDNANMVGQTFIGDSTGSIVKNVISVAVVTPFYFIGFDVIPQAAEEINVPLKKISKMMILSVVMAVAFYALVIVAVGRVLNPEAILASQAGTGLVTADAMAAAFKTPVMAKVIIVGGMCGIITSWNSFLIGGSRAMYSMAESYMIPKFFAKLHPKYKTPVNALILIGAVTMIAPLAGRKMLVWISDAGNFGCCMAYCMVAMYCIPGSGATLVAQEWVAVGSWCLLGVVFYAVCKRKYKENFGMLVEIISDEDAATLMPEADDAELDKVIDEAIERVLKKYAA